MYAETQPGHRAGIGGRRAEPGRRSSRQRARSGRAGGGGPGDVSAGGRRGAAQGAQVARGGRGAAVAQRWQQRCLAPGWEGVAVTPTCLPAQSSLVDLIESGD